MLLKKYSQMVAENFTIQISNTNTTTTNAHGLRSKSLKCQPDTGRGGCHVQSRPTEELVHPGVESISVNAHGPKQVQHRLHIRWQHHHSCLSPTLPHVAAETKFDKTAATGTYIAQQGRSQYHTKSHQRDLPQPHPQKMNETWFVNTSIWR